MGRLIEKGKIRGWGMSQANADQIRRANAVTPLSAIQNEYSMMERSSEKEVIPTCRGLGIGFVPFSPLASGFLSGKYSKDTVYSGDDVRRAITRFTKENVVANQPLVDLLYEFAKRKVRQPHRSHSHGCCTRKTSLSRSQACAKKNESGKIWK